MKALLTTPGYPPALDSLSFVDDALRATLDRVWRGPALTRTARSAWSGSPEFDVKTHDDGWTLQAEVPGLPPEALTIEVHGSRLTVRGRRELEAPEGFRAVRRERAHLGFERSFEFGRGFDPDAIQAELKLGVLKISVPMRAEARPRTIAIQASE